MPCQFSLYACRKQLDSRVRLQKNHSGNREIHANPSNNVWNFIDHYKRRAYSRYQQRKKPQNLTSTRNVKQLTKKVYSRSLNSAEKYPNKFPKILLWKYYLLPNRIQLGLCGLKKFCTMQKLHYSKSH